MQPREEKSPEQSNEDSIKKVFQDIYDIESSLERLQEIHQKYLQLVNEAPVGIYIVQDGNIIFGNEWLCSYSGYCLDDLPMSALNVIAPGDRAFVADQMIRRIQGKDALPNYAVRFLKKSGEIKEVDLIARAVTYQGKPAIVGSIVDASRRVEVEKDLKNSKIRLEESNRFNSLINEILSHDLLNRLWVAEEYAKFVLKSGVSEEQRENIEKLKGSLDKALAILDDTHKCIILDEMTRMDSELLDLAALLEESLEDFKTQLGRKDIKVSTRVVDNAVVMGNRLIKDVFLNLISNAVKYSPRGSEVSIEIDDGEALRISFRDRGPGIPDDLKDRIFKRFERLDKSRIKGLGLGLEIVKRIVAFHEGRIWVEDNPGGGSVFIVELPRKHPEDRGLKKTGSADSGPL